MNAKRISITELIKLSNLFFLIIAFHISAPIIFAQTTPKIEQIDIHKFEEKNKYFVVFASRNNTLSGHAFVMWGVEDESLQQSTYKAFGFYPTSDSGSTHSKAVIGSVPGAIMDEIAKQSVKNASKELIVRVDSKQFENSLAVLEKFVVGKPEFSLVENDCVTFAKEVGESLGLNMPERGLLTPDVWIPDSYINKLIDESVKERTGTVGSSNYKGQTYQDKPHGKGILETPSKLSTPEKKLFDTYEGSFRFGLKDGKGVLSFADGGKYTGGFKNDVFHGKGEYIKASGEKYIGDYKNGLANGVGVLVSKYGKYEGEFKDGSFNGEGTFAYPNGDTYKGTFKDDMFHGKGTYNFADGKVYVGDFKNDKREGFGVQTWVGGDRYEGEWQNDQRNGQGTMYFTDVKGLSWKGRFKNSEYYGVGTMTFPDGTQYNVLFEPEKNEKGETTGFAMKEYLLKEGNGKGKYTWSNGDTYEGDFKDGLPDGKGTFISKEKDVKYVGDYKKSQASGKGVMTYSGGITYEGEFEHGEFNGQGTLSFPNGKRYQGGFKDGRFSGNGVIGFPNGDRYGGEFKEGKFNGKGTYTWANGNKYEGEYKEDKRDGKGTFSATDGSKFVGEYKEDKRTGQGTSFFTDGSKYIANYSNGSETSAGTYYRPDGSVENVTAGNAADGNSRDKGGDFNRSGDKPERDKGYSFTMGGGTIKDASGTRETPERTTFHEKPEKPKP